MPLLQQLLDRLQNKSATIGVIGIGYVGFPLLLSFAHSGYSSIGFDVDMQKIEHIQSGRSFIPYISDQRISEGLVSGCLSVTNDFSLASAVDALIICVPTPLNKYREPDLHFVIDVIDSIAPYMRKGQIISLESTTYPGTTEEELLPRIEQQGFKVGEDYFLVFSPEREDPGNAHFAIGNIPKICGGVTPNCLLAGTALYQNVVSRVVPVSNTKTAEMTKLLENIHRAVNIGLVNELKIIADTMGIDIYEVIDAASTKPFGFTPYYPGPGLGGHCVPIDPFYLTWKSRSYGVHTRFIELAGEINSDMPAWTVGKIMNALNQKAIPVKNSNILILGLSYKKNIGDTRESPSLSIVEKLVDLGALVTYSDPHVREYPRKHHRVFDLVSVEVTKERLAASNCVVIAVDHDAFAFSQILEYAPLIIDTRGVFRGKHPNVIHA